MGGLTPAAGGTETAPDPGALGSGTVGARTPNQQEASAGGAGSSMSGQGGTPSSPGP